MKLSEKVEMVKRILLIRRIEATEEQIMMLGTKNLRNWSPERIVCEISRVVF